MNAGAWYALILELLILSTIVYSHDWMGLILSVVYFYFSATRYAIGQLIRHEKR